MGFEVRVTDDPARPFEFWQYAAGQSYCMTQAATLDDLLLGARLIIGHDFAFPLHPKH